MNHLSDMEMKSAMVLACLIAIVGSATAFAEDPPKSREAGQNAVGNKTDAGSLLGTGVAGHCR
ncbi:MAG: hypothetical protein NTW21_04530 [Verrucomicrobia bacterium]|nr:hypothetical protein [Verrucomicrobiota bacterium]